MDEEDREREGREPFELVDTTGDREDKGAADLAERETEECVARRKEGEQEFVGSMEEQALVAAGKERQ